MAAGSIRAEQSRDISTQTPTGDLTRLLMLSTADAVSSGTVRFCRCFSETSGWRKICDGAVSCCRV